MTLPGNLLHPLKLDVVGFKEEDHDYHFRVELPEPSCCQSCGGESVAIQTKDAKFVKELHDAIVEAISAR